MNKKIFKIGISILAAFCLWTILVSVVDVAAVGPEDSKVGFSTINSFVHRLIGVHMSLYVITDWLGLVPFFVCLCFVILGLIQWIKRKSIFNVDRSIIILGVFYMAVIITYILFEIVVINRRPVLIDGYLESSYPSSTTMLVMSVMPTASMQLSLRIKNNKLKHMINIIIWSFVAFMVVGRLISGVHWLTDIIGGTLLSSGLVMIYYSITYTKKAP